ncbi:MAG: hypothetical protein AB4290_03800 [Spirulina sp.]
MSNSIDRNSPFGQDIPELDLAGLQELLQQQAKRTGRNLQPRG